MAVLVFGPLLAGVAILLVIWLGICGWFPLPGLVASKGDERGAIVLGHRRRSREISPSEYAAYLTALGRVLSSTYLYDDDLDAPAAPLRTSQAKFSPRDGGAVEEGETSSALVGMVPAYNTPPSHPFVRDASTREGEVQVAALIQGSAGLVTTSRSLSPQSREVPDVSHGRAPERSRLRSA